MHSNKFNKVLSSLLALAMMFSALMFPSAVWADDLNDGEQEETSELIEVTEVTEATEATDEPEQDAAEPEVAPSFDEPDGFEVGATEVDLYALDSKHTISIPETLYQEYQIDVSGVSGDVTPTFRIISNSMAGYTGSDYNSYAITVSETGLVQPNVYTYYYRGGQGYTYPIEGYTSVRVMPRVGAAVVRVTVGSEHKDILFHAYDYGKVYTEQVICNYIAENITTDMSAYEIADKAAQLAASYPYKGGNSYASDMIAGGGGDCWASADVIVTICTRMGLHAWGREGYRDVGAGTGHRNALVEDPETGHYFEVEAGYSVNYLPRLYTIKERTSLFSYRKPLNGTVEVYQYDGDKQAESLSDTLVIPSQIDGYTVVSLGNYLLSGDDYSMGYLLDSSTKRHFAKVVIPATVTNIGEGVFSSCDELTDVYFEGTEEQWNSITFGANNEKLSEVVIHFANPAQIKGRSLSLQGYIVLNFYLSLPESFTSDPDAYIMLNDDVVAVPAPESDGRYKLSYNLAAAEISKDVTVTLYDGNGAKYPLLDKDGIDATEGFTFSAQDYIALVNASSSSSATAELKAMLKYMAEYGKYAQILFDVNPDSVELSPTITDEISEVDLSTLLPYKLVMNRADNAGITYNSSSLIMDYATAVNHFFTLDSNKSIDDFVFTVDGVEVDVNSVGKYTLGVSGTRYKLTINDIEAANIGKAFVISIKSRATGNEVLHLEYSALSYAYRVLEMSGTYSNIPLQNTVRALYLYYRKAAAYFGVEVVEPVVSPKLDAVADYSWKITDYGGDEPVVYEGVFYDIAIHRESESSSWVPVPDMASLLSAKVDELGLFVWSQSAKIIESSIRNVR